MTQRPINTEACRRLCAAVIETAVDDYRMHTRAGRIAGGKLTSKREGVKRNGAHHSQTDAAQVLHFFRDGCLDAWVDVGGLQIDPGMMRSKLGIS